MFEVIIIPIVLSEGGKYIPMLLLFQKLQHQIHNLFKIKIKFKLLKNIIKIKYNYKNIMYKSHEYILRLLADRNVKRQHRRKSYLERCSEIIEEAQERQNQIEDKQNEENMLAMGYSRCKNIKCQCYSQPATILEQIQNKALVELKKGVHIPVDIEKLKNLIMDCEDKEDLKQYKHLLKFVSVECAKCKSELNEDVLINPKYIMYLQDKAKQIKCI
jgi:hypothetical protein